MTETLLDVKGLNCPLPVLRANRTLRGLAPGDRLRVLATDRAAVADFQAYCREAGHALLAWSEEGGVLSFQCRATRRRTARHQESRPQAWDRTDDPAVMHTDGFTGQSSAIRHDSARIAGVCFVPGRVVAAFRRAAGPAPDAGR
jgi:tRNA 2-thiouridine synthesizing protein A